MKMYLYLLGVCLFAFSIIGVVFHFGDIPNKHDNGFKRNYFVASHLSMHKMDLGDTLYDIVGSTRSTIYITTAREGEVLEIGKELSENIKRIKIPFFARFYDSLQFNSLAIKIDSPYIYLFAENKPAIIKTNFDSTLFEIKILPPGPFSREVMAGADCFILRKLESRLIDQIFVRYNFSTVWNKKIILYLLLQEFTFVF
jgi:hypothetical protein